MEREREYYTVGDASLSGVTMKDVHLDSDLHKDPEATAEV